MQQQKQKFQRLTRFAIAFVISAVVMYALFAVALPFYIQMPGSAEEIKPMIQLSGEETSKTGVFMLTTVSSRTANIAGYLLALLHPYAEIHLKQDVLRGRSESEYYTEQQYVMSTSQSSAIQAAYRAAGVPFRIETIAVTVMRTVAGMPAEKVLRPGDQILQADGQPIQNTVELQRIVQSKSAGDKVEVEFRRKGVTHKETIEVGQLPAQQDASGQSVARTGIGISLGDVLTVKAEDEAKQVAMKVEDIGGPSAGLMFALEIYNRLQPPPTDISKGYRIAGTGKIGIDGEVCPIGGVQHKIVAAHRAKADFFFVPKDMSAPECGLSGQVTNASDAEKQARQIGTPMVVVPVGTLEEALQYLAALPDKPMVK